MKKFITLFAILFAGTMLFTSCENQSKDSEEFNGINQLMDNSVKNGDEAALKSLKNNNKKTMTKIDQTAAPVPGDKIAIFETSMGTIKAKLFPTATPKTFENFKGLADKGYYNGTIFHRVIKDFMIQGGDPDGTGMGGDSFFGGNFEDEFNADLKNIKGALSMANRGPNTNGSQFFIVQAEETPWLNGKHTVFGQVFEGLDIVDKIANVKTGAMDKPVDPITVKSIKVETLK